jgi:hypothetical protein
MSMGISVEQVQRLVKEWAVEHDPEVEVQVLPPHEDPRTAGEIVPVRIQRHGYRMTVGLPERDLAGLLLPPETRRTLERVVRLLRYMEARGLRRAGRASEGSD